MAEPTRSGRPCAQRQLAASKSTANLATSSGEILEWVKGSDHARLMRLANMLTSCRNHMVVGARLMISALVTSHHETSHDPASKVKTWWIGFF
ncbi:hypothetical protein MRS44_000256 [Fusarium solani]|uniref:uncharacterized protein n=1 Tax=Fusarium solani TaxID=169388 RepID=UPI0032C45FCE|nr:hypothetical protein MRS44_000256 [Fusarium solani]